MKIIIRAYDEMDEEGCLQAFKSNVPQYFTKGEIAEFKEFLNDMKRISYNESCLKSTEYFVVVYKAQIIGGGGFGKQTYANTITLAWGFVHKEFHKKGSV